MKLIEILVRELPKHGGWPEGVKRIEQASSLRIFDAAACSPSWKSDYYLERCDDWEDESVTIRQYEAALAASNAEWDGDGLPPVGSNVEARFEGEWVEVTVAYSDCPESQSNVSAWNEALVFNRITTHPFWADEFRPIRSEADKKRDEAVNAMNNHKNDPVDVTENRYHAIYDAIAAGKIPHIRID